MKKYIFMAVALAIGIGVAFAIVGKGDANALNVNDVASDPTAFTGTITVTGVMAATSESDPTIFGIMDKKELSCTSPNCNKLILPVRHLGKAPAIGDEVRLTGSFVNDGRGYFFSATAVKVLRNHKIGG